MNTPEIRSKFINFFKHNNHKYISSSSLVPINDPTLLFSNAGMNQFKDYFTGKSNAENKRAVTIQKCVRAGGKHNDLDNVGFTARHHTFFEMLGNFSFGDYFKEETIFYAWKFLTEELKFPKEKLFVTVHHTDEDAFKLWKKIANIDDNHLFRKGDKDNFWEMGEFGPCGPCSEIFYDHGESFSSPNFKPTKEQDILDDENRYVEIWNLVFMQFEKTSKGKFDLPHPSIDTGAGLERIAAALQGKYWNYDTDIFTPIIDKIQSVTNKNYTNDKFKGHMRVVADHIRSASMLITDGVIPSNDGRGYVLRRIIRRAVRHLKELNAKPGSLHQLIPTFIETIINSYPENASNISLAEKYIKLEEEKFLETLDTGIKFLNKAILNNVQNNILSGESAFKLYDTYGFPLDLTETILKEKKLSVDEKEFHLKMKEQKELSKKSWKGNINVDDSIFYNLEKQVGKNIFHYDKMTTIATLIAKEKHQDHYLLIFDNIPFYGESGGQAGDIGEILDDQGNILTQIINCLKPFDDFVVLVATNTDKLNINDKYTLMVDQNNRKHIARNHTATHLLHSALEQVLGDHVKQAGSMVGNNRLRFDFTHPALVKPSELDEVSKIVNRIIQDQLNINVQQTNIKEATKLGAKALFGEKYGEDVRVVSILNNNSSPFSVELCGGTHVENTSEIGLFTIVSESSLSTGVRRIEALTSLGAQEYLNKRSNEFSNIELLLNAKDTQATKYVDKLLKDLKANHKEINLLKDSIQNHENKNIFDNPELINDNYPFKSIMAPDNADIRKLSDNFISKYQNGFVFIAKRKNDKMTVLLRAGNKAPKIKCSDVLNNVLKDHAGRSGGRPDMAQGASDIFEISLVNTKLKKALEENL